MGLKRSKDGTADPMQVVSRFLDAANHHDADALRACVHHDFESIQPIHPGRNFRGSGQLISNWKAIFEAEPGFRLTVLRSAVEDDTVWVEVHGAGDSAEAAGIFIVGVEDGRIRWIRVYSDLVEPAPEIAPAEVAAAEVLPAEEMAAEPAAVGDGAVSAEVPEVPAATEDEPAAAAGDGDGQEGRPLRLVEPADDEVEADGAEEPGAATSLRLVDDEAADGDDASSDLEDVETGERLDVPSGQADETTETDETEASGDRTDGPADDAATGEAAQADQSGGEAATAEDDGEGGEPRTEDPEAAPGEMAGASGDGEVDETPSDEADTEVTSGLAEIPADEADTEVTSGLAEIPSDEADTDATATVNVVESPSDEADPDATTHAVATQSADADGETSHDEADGEREDDAGSEMADASGDGAGTATAEVEVEPEADHEGPDGDRAGDDEGVTSEAGDVTSDSPDNSPARRDPELAEPTSPPLPRATSSEPSAGHEEQPSWRRMWRRMRGRTGS